MSILRTITVLTLLTVGLTACGWDDDVDSLAATEGLPTLQQKLEAHEWLLDTDDDSIVTMAFLDDEVSGRGPCNVYGGALDLDGDDGIEITDVRSTQIACEPTVMEAERDYFDALESVTRATFDDDDDEELVLEGGGAELHYDAIDVDELLEGEWEITDVARGDAIESLTAAPATITFTDDGDVRLVTGCNDATTSFELDGDELTVDDDFPMTEMGCESARQEQQDALVAALRAAARVELAPDSLVILDDDGLIVLQAVPSSKGN
jgi:heat shock protein HslJ